MPLGRAVAWWRAIG